MGTTSPHTNHIGDSHPTRKRRLRVDPVNISSRRALSCTECKRRKTKCSALGQTPCESCILRKKPEDCVWRDANPKTSDRCNDSSKGTTSMADMRRQIAELQNVVGQRTFGDTREPSPVPTDHPTYLSTDISNGTPYLEATVDNRRASTGLARLPQEDIEAVTSSLEDVVVGGRPGTRPTETTNTSYSRASLPPSFVDELLPGTMVVDWLLGVYFDGPLHKGWHAVERFTFMTQYRQLLPFDQGRRWLGTDPAWEAIYYMILALTIKLNDIAHVQLFFPSYGPTQIQQMPLALYELSMQALQRGRYLEVPQVRHIQTALLQIIFLFHFGETVSQANLAMRHLGDSITTAQWLNLDKEAGGYTLPLEDPALSLLSPWAGQELCNRLLHMLAFVEGTTATQGGRCRLIMGKGLVPNLLPANLNDIDLQAANRPTEWPSTQFTEATLSRVGTLFVLAIRQIPQASETHLSQEDVLRQDKSLRSILSSLPPFPGDSSAPDGATISSQHWMMHHLSNSIHNRLIRLHRPYMVEALFQGTWQTSRLIALDSAKRIIDTQLLFSSYPQLCPRKRWLLSACLVLLVDSVFQPLDSTNTPGTSRASRSEHKARLGQALEVFCRPASDRQDPGDESSCARAVRVLQYLMDSQHIPSSSSSEAHSRLKELLQDAKRRISISDESPSLELPGSVDSQGFAAEYMSGDLLGFSFPDLEPHASSSSEKRPINSSAESSSAAFDIPLGGTSNPMEPDSEFSASRYAIFDPNAFVFPSNNQADSDMATLYPINFTFDDGANVFPMMDDNGLDFGWMLEPQGAEEALAAVVGIFDSSDPL